MVLLLSWTGQHLLPSVKQTQLFNSNAEYIQRRLFSEICRVSLFLLQQQVLTGYQPSFA